MNQLNNRSPIQIKQKNSHLLRSAIAFSFLSFSLTLQAGIITSVPSATGADGFGGWNLENVEIIVNGTQGPIGDFTSSWYDENTGAYVFASDSDNTYAGHVSDNSGTVMGYVLAKDYPVGEPSGIKIVNDDSGVKAPKPNNCIMATSYLADHFLDSAEPQQVTCSSPFQSHKRYKLAMLPSTVDGLGVDGLGSDSVDLVFNVEGEDGSRDYQVFQKINNWTDGRLEGFSVQVGFGVGDTFQTTAEAGVPLDNLNISVPSEIWDATQLATFSAGLFGPEDKHTGKLGFFDPTTRAGYRINEYVADGAQDLTDTLTATETLGSDYNEVPAGAAIANQFGPWLPNTMLPSGVFFDDDGNPETDAELLAWYGYNPATAALGWMGGSQDPEGAFRDIPDSEIQTMGENLSYTMDLIDDLVNVGISYVVTIGDVTSFPGTTFTIRVTPTADSSGMGAPDYVGVEPSPLLVFTNKNASVLLETNPEFVVGSLLTARVGDADLNLDPLVAETVDITVSSDSGLISDAVVTLTELGLNRGVFAATLPELFSDVAVGTKVTMTYFDADTGAVDVDGNAITASKISSTIAVPEISTIPSNVSITDFSVPDTLLDGQARNLKLSITNDREALEAATGTVLITGSDGSEFTGEFTDLALGRKLKLSFNWIATLEDPAVDETVTWIATVTVDDEIVDFETATTLITVKKGKNSKN